MIFDTNIERIVFDKKEYPYICNIKVLAQIQEAYGDLTAFEDNLYGIEPYFDADGVRDRSKDKHIFPDIKMVCEVFNWMMIEGLAITKEKLKPLSVDDLMRQSEVTITEMVSLIVGSYSKNFIKARKK